MRRATLKQEVLEILKGKNYNKPPKDKKQSIFKGIPEVKSLPLTAGVLIFTTLTMLGIVLSATIGTYVFFGVITLGGLIAIAETNKYVRYLIKRSNKFLDLLIFGLSIYAIASLGITIAASLTFAGLGFTLVYAPYIRSKNV